MSPSIVHDKENAHGAVYFMLLDHTIATHDNKSQTSANGGGSRKVIEI